MTIRMAYEMVMPYHLHMPSYFLETFTEYPSLEKGVTLSTFSPDSLSQPKDTTNINIEQ